MFYLHNHEDSSVKVNKTLFKQPTTHNKDSAFIRKTPVLGYQK